MMSIPQGLKIGIVGPCGSGKSSLAEGLTQLGYIVRHIAQEHSYVPTMWKKIANPTYLIYLDSTYQTCTHRRKLDWTIDEFQIQLNRLRHARENADLVIFTDDLNKKQVLDNALEFLHKVMGGQMD